MTMATRAIVTSQPDVACEICLRRLLRGEQPEVFLAGGQRRTVCELCVPRASDEGWLRESDDHPVSRRTPRGGRGRTLLDRLRQLRDPAAERTPTRRQAAKPATQDSERYEFLPGPALSATGKPTAFFEESFSDPASEPFTELAISDGEELHPAEEPSNIDLKTARAIEVFNSSEQPRRIAGIARSLGTASVTAHQADDSSSRVSIVVAWELCWYRYEVDLADELAGAVVVDQGTELSELPDADTVANAAADEHGALHLL
jgi:hypothetical protein